jgi:SPP1 family predicted phage head-tail adaptor
MDERITIQEPVNTSDEYNQPVPDWTDVATVWAMVTDSSGNEREQADQITAYMTTSFVIRYRHIDETMRIYRPRTGRYYNIRSLKHPDRKRTIEIVAEMMDDPESEPAEGRAYSSAFASAYD